MLMSRGVSILEVVIVSAIILVVVTGIAGAWQLYFRTTAIVSEQTQVSLALGEIEEAINILRDTGWASQISSKTLNTNYYLTWDGNDYSLSSLAFSLSATSTLIGRVIFQSVFRDAQSNIASGGTLDADTRLVAIAIYKNENPSDIFLQSEMLIHNLYDN